MALGSVEECSQFFERFDDEASVVSDPDARLYGPFGLERASTGQLLSTSVFAAGLRATLKGNLPGVPVGDVMRMPGAFLVQSGAVHWKFIAEHVGEHPPLENVAQRARELERA